MSVATIYINQTLMHMTGKYTYVHTVQIHSLLKEKLSRFTTWDHPINRVRCVGIIDG